MPPFFRKRETVGRSSPAVMSAGSVRLPLRTWEADVGEQAVADALSADGVIDVSALGDIEGGGLAGAAIADTALGGAVGFAQDTEVADAGTHGVDVGVGDGALQHGDLEGKASG